MLFGVLLVLVLVFAGCVGSCKKEKVVMEKQSGDWSPELSEAEEETLFEIANDTLAWCVLGHYGTFDFDKYSITDKLKIKRATFVTLKINGQLRGCIGSLTPISPLYHSVHENAANAAMRDPRFTPVTNNELPYLQIQVSVLSPITPIPNLEKFQLGKQGIILTKGSHSAVFLPEVATEQGWNLEQMMTALSQKAGLPPDGWKSGASFEVFTSVAIGED